MDTLLLRVDELKDIGNKDFSSGHYLPAVEHYTNAISILETQVQDTSLVASKLAILLCNRAFASLKVELYGDAIADATRALTLDASCVKAYYRRGSANLALQHYTKARDDFRAVLKIKPGDADATAKLDTCAKAIKRAAFEAAIATDATKPLLERLNIDSLVVDSSYTGPNLPEIPAPGAAASSITCAEDENAINCHGISFAFVKQMLAEFRAQRMIHRKYVLQILLRLKKILDTLPSLVHVPFPPNAEYFNVCGDTHGQYYDTLNIWDKAGLPSPTNPFLFNGDFVDRGSFSLENVLALFAYKLLYPESMVCCIIIKYLVKNTIELFKIDRYSSYLPFSLSNIASNTRKS